MTRPSAGLKAVTYAESQLGVNAIFEAAVLARNTLDGTLTELSTVRDRKSDLEYRLQDAEMEVASDERGKHPDMSAAAMEKHMRIALNNTDGVRELREQITKTKSDIDGLEMDKTMAQTDINIAVARLTELGGYLNYLAAIKLTQPLTPAKPTSTGE